VTGLSREPGWLVSAVDQRLALLEEQLEAIGARDQYDIVVTSLTPDPGGDEHNIWDKSCDHCGNYLPDTILSGYVNRRTKAGVRVQIHLGACSACAVLP
jgi:hypothetical protein